jgi:P27 family predicted phage terminase small subunit
MYKIQSSWHQRAKENMESIISSLEVEVLDHVSLDLLGDALSTMYYATEGIAKEGYIVKVGDIPKANPYVKIKNDAKIEAFKIMKQFGLTPIDRKRLNKDVVVEEDSEFERLLEEMV